MYEKEVNAVGINFDPLHYSSVTGVHLHFGKVLDTQYPLLHLDKKDIWIQLTFIGETTRSNKARQYLRIWIPGIFRYAQTNFFGICIPSQRLCWDEL